MDRVDLVLEGCWGGQRGSVVGGPDAGARQKVEGDSLGCRPLSLSGWREPGVLRSWPAISVGEGRALDRRGQLSSSPVRDSQSLGTCRPVGKDQLQKRNSGSGCPGPPLT